MRYQITVRRFRQQGSILLMAVVVIAGIGAIAAGLLAILQQQTVSLTESVQMNRGIGTADSYRLVLIDKALRNRTIDTSLIGSIKSDLGGLLEDADFPPLKNSEYSAAVSRIDDYWGYEFFYNQNGISSNINGSLPESYDVIRNNTDESNAVITNDNGSVEQNNEVNGSLTVTVENDAIAKVTNRVKGSTTVTIERNATAKVTNLDVKGSVTINVSSNAYVELGDQKISGTLSINIGSEATVCEAGKIEVTGQTSGLPGESCALSGNDLWTFQSNN